MVFARTFATAVRFSCNFILHNNYFVVVFLEKREVYYILETSVILCCLYWSLVLSALWFLSLSLVHFIAVLFLFLFLLVLGTQGFLSHLFPICLFLFWFPSILCCLLTLYYTHIPVFCSSSLFRTSSCFTLLFSFSLVYSKYSSVPVVRSLMCFVSLYVGSTIYYYNIYYYYNINIYFHKCLNIWVQYLLSLMSVPAFLG